MTESFELPYAHGGPLGRALMRAQPEDFEVRELLGFAPTGSGEHLFARVRKRGWTTEAVTGLLAKACGVSRGAVSYAGMKDKWAVTEQWFSVHLPGRAEPLAVGELAPGVELVELARHNKKLRRGVLTGNAFRLRLRELEASPNAVGARLHRIGRYGVPNYFGEQRFGRDGDNVERARAMFAGEFRPRDRALRGILLSSARSFLFNAVLAERIRRGDWDRALPGELVMLDGRQSLFAAQDDDPELPRRLRALALHPTGPLVGRGEPQPSGEVRALEDAVLTPYADLVEGLYAVEMEAARRALRVRVADLGWCFPEPGCVELSFSLMAGSYATGVLREIFQAEEPARKPTAS
jgi:tRNA pseudouridine13 synthase